MCIGIGYYFVDTNYFIPLLLLTFRRSYSSIKTISTTINLDIIFNFEVTKE